MRILFTVLLTVSLLGWSKPALAKTKNYVFLCNFSFSDPQLPSVYGNLTTLRIDTSGLPDKQVCGNSRKECREAGFKGHIERDETGNYINYPVLIAQQCVKMDFAPNGKFMEIKTGVIPHLDKATLSIKEGGGDRKDLLRTEAGSLVNGLNDIHTIYENGEKFYFTRCEIFHEERVIFEGNGKVDLLSINQPVNTCPH